MKNNAAFALWAVLCVVFPLAIDADAATPVTNADELVAQHLNSIASTAARADLKTRVAKGPVHFTILVGGAGNLDGKAFLVSDGNKFQFMMKLLNNDYRGEQFIFDGEKDKVAYSTARQTRSSFGDFVYVQDAGLREGLLGGVLSTAWPLLNLDERKPRLTFGGLKKIDGQELYELGYHPRKSSDLEIQLFFDPQTYRHVETIYSYSISRSISGVDPSQDSPAAPAPTGPGAVGIPGGVNAETQTARRQMTRYRLQEKFSDFKTVDGVTLPTHYDLQFTQELQNGKTTLSDWDLKDLDVASNVPVDARNFDVK
jgi:hypothetical protein